MVAEQETSLAPSGSKCIALKKVPATLLGLFGARGIVPSLDPRYAPDCDYLHGGAPSLSVVLRTMC